MSVTAECCDEPTEDCSSGMPATCNAGCAAVLVPYWQDCASAIRQEDSSISQVLEAAIDLCPKVDRPGPLIAAYGTQSTDVTLDFLQPETTYYIGVRAHAKDSPSLSLGTWGPGQGLSGASVEF